MQSAFHERKKQVPRPRGGKKLDILEKQPVILEETCTKLCKDLDFFSQL